MSLAEHCFREEPTEEWKDRGIKEHQYYSILTAEISKATFGLTPSEYKIVKELKRKNLRDHMSDLELIFPCLERLQQQKLQEIQMHKDF